MAPVFPPLTGSCLTLSKSKEQIDLQSLALLFLAAFDMSEGSHVLARYSRADKEYKVNVRYATKEHVATSGKSLQVALARSVRWLREQGGRTEVPA